MRFLVLALVGLLSLPACRTPLPATQASPVADTRHALILGGGGVTARGWELGILKGLQEAGIDPIHADIVVGESAGAFLGVQLLSGRTVDALYELTAPRPGNGSGPTQAAEPPFDPVYAEATRQMWTNSTAVTPEQRMEIGRRALAAPRVIDEEAQIRITANALADIHDWPNQPISIATVDIADGSIRLFTAGDGVPLDRVLAASSAVPGRIAPITIGDHRYMDGQVGGTNVDGALGYGVVLALTPGFGPKTEQELETLRSQGSRVMAIAPDADSEVARGPDPQDLRRVRPSAEAGHRQASAVAAEVRNLWGVSGSSR
jgi:NTE family protein